MGISLTLFRVFGIEVKVHWSFVLILAYGAVAFSNGRVGPIEGVFYGLLVTVLLFVCVLLHEFGHALAAKYYGINVPQIVLLPIGGVASLEKMPDKPGQELVVAIAGPLVNIAIAILLAPLVLLSLGLQMNNGMPLATPADAMALLRTPGLGNLLFWLLSTNLLLALFNLLPAFPMDGGRILRALLALAMPYIQATRVAVLVGRIMAVLFAVWGIFGGGIFLLLIAFFVYVGGSSELEAVESRAVLKRIPARSALTPTAASLYTSERIQRAVDLIATSYQTDYPVLDLSGNFAGVLTRARLVGVLREVGTEGRVADAMQPASEVPSCSPDADLYRVWEQMASTGNRAVAVRDQTGFLGLITIDDITELVHVMGAAMEAGERRDDTASIAPLASEGKSDAAA